MHTIADQWDWSVLCVRAMSEARRVLPSHHDAEDAAQDALVRAWRARDNCTDRPTAWIGAIARNEALRTAGRRTPTPHDDPSLAEPGTLLAQFDHDRLEDRLDVNRALDRLHPYDRLLVALYYGADVSAKEVANRLGSTESTIRVRLFRARKRLRAILEE